MDSEGGGEPTPICGAHIEWQVLLQGQARADHSPLQTWGSQPDKQDWRFGLRIRVGTSLGEPIKRTKTEGQGWIRQQGFWNGGP